MKTCDPSSILVQLEENTITVVEKRNELIALSKDVNKSRRNGCQIFKRITEIVALGNGRGSRFL